MSFTFRKKTQQNSEEFLVSEQTKWQAGSESETFEEVILITENDVRSQNEYETQSASVKQIAAVQEADNEESKHSEEESKVTEGTVQSVEVYDNLLLTGLQNVEFQYSDQQFFGTLKLNEEGLKDDLPMLIL